MSEAFCFCSSTRYLSSFKWLLDRMCDKWYSLQIERNRHRKEYLLTIYRKVASSRLSRLIAHFWIFRLLMKGKFDAYVL